MYLCPECGKEGTIQDFDYDQDNEVCNECVKEDWEQDTNYMNWQYERSKL